MASHRSAAWLWLDRGGGEDDVDGDNSGPQPVDITVLDRRRSRTLPGVAVHRPTDRVRLAPQRIENIRCTNILRTLVDLGAVDPSGVSDLLGHLLSCDGWTTHGLDREQFERDRRRDADLTAAGWIVSRHTYRAITRDAGTTAHRLRALLARQTD